MVAKITKVVFDLSAVLLGTIYTAIIYIIAISAIRGV